MKKKTGKRELGDYLCRKHAELKQRQTEIIGELKELEEHMETVDKIVEMKK